MERLLYPFTNDSIYASRKTVGRAKHTVCVESCKWPFGVRLASFIYCGGGGEAFGLRFTAATLLSFGRTALVNPCTLLLLTLCLPSDSVQREVQRVITHKHS